MAVCLLRSQHTDLGVLLAPVETRGDGSWRRRELSDFLDGGENAFHTPQNPDMHIGEGTISDRVFQLLPPFLPLSRLH